MSDKKKRLFITTPGSDDQWWYAGGPDVEDAAKGVMNLVREDIRELLSGTSEGATVELEIREMTDEEVAALPHY